MKHATTGKDIVATVKASPKKVMLRIGAPAGSGNSRAFEMTLSEALDLANQLIDAVTRMTPKSKRT